MDSKAEQVIYIIVRGINRGRIFFDDTDRDDFLGRFGGILSDGKIACFAWAVMTNHPHLLYPELVKEGVSAGRRPELTGGGLVRSAGGRSALRAMRNGESWMKGDGTESF